MDHLGEKFVLNLNLAFDDLLVNQRLVAVHLLH